MEIVVIACDKFKIRKMKRAMKVMDLPPDTTVTLYKSYGCEAVFRNMKWLNLTAIHMMHFLMFFQFKVGHRSRPVCLRNVVDETGVYSLGEYIVESELHAIRHVAGIFKHLGVTKETLPREKWHFDGTFLNVDRAKLPRQLQLERILACVRLIQSDSLDSIDPIDPIVPDNVEHIEDLKSKLGNGYIKLVKVASVSGKKTIR